MVDEGQAQQQIHEAHLEYDKSNLNRAIELFDEGVALDPTRWDGFYLGGRISLDVGDPTGAFRRLLQAHDLVPNDYDVLIELGNAYQDSGKYQKAENTWRKAISGHPTRDLAYNNLGIMQYEREKYEDAVATFTSGIMHTSSLRLFKGRALSFMEIGRFEQAVQDIEHLMSGMPNTAVFHWYRGQCYLALGETDSALADAERACEIDPEDSDFKSFLASCRKPKDG